MMSVKTWKLDLVRPEHVMKAAMIWDRMDRRLAKDKLYFEAGFDDSKKYDVIINGVAYPPKPIGSFAHHLAVHRLIPRKEFGGSKGGKWHRCFQELGFDVVYKGTRNSIFPKASTCDSSKKSACEDIAQITSNRQLSDTQRLAEIMCRIGQGEFRNALMAVWKGCCAVTGCSIPEALRASHIKPWSECSSAPEERHDPQNGLLLTANLDALFDRNLISFDDEGLILISKKVPQSEYKRLGLRSDWSLRESMSSRMLNFMRMHRERLI